MPQKPTHLRVVERATETLRGLLAGIVADHKLADEEVAHIEEWISVNAHLHGLAPFNEIYNFMGRVLADHVVDADERDEVLQWCQDFADVRAPLRAQMAHAIQRLHGFMQGIRADGQLEAIEVHDLRDWLLEYHAFHDLWPFCDAWALAERVLADHVVNEYELEELDAFCRAFDERYAEQMPEHDETAASVRSNAPMLESVGVPFDADAAIVFPERTFCFTGVARTGKRSLLEEIVADLRGAPAKRVTLSLHYLVVGDLSNPAWMYATYGRKVEEVMSNRKAQRANTLIIRELQFLEAAQRSAGI